MWALFRVVSNQIMADAWKELLEAEGIPVQVVPEAPNLTSARRIYIPEVKMRVVDDILRKI